MIEKKDANEGGLIEQAVDLSLQVKQVRLLHDTRFCNGKSLLAAF